MVSARGWVSFFLNIQFILMPLGAVMKVCLFVVFFSKLFDLSLQLLSFITSFVSVSRIWEESRPSWLLLAGLLYRMKGREGILKVGGAREE